MGGLLDVVLAWLVPALVVFVATAVAVAVIVWAVRAARRGRRARASADAARVPAGSALVALDDAVAELDLEVGLSGALYGGTADAALRRARIAAQHARDDAFSSFRVALDDTAHPATRRSVARRVQQQAECALRDVHRARSAHAEWVDRNIDAREQLIDARRRATELARAQEGSTALLNELRARFDDVEWADAAQAATQGTQALADAAAAFETAAARAADPTFAMLPILAEGERALQRADDAQRRVEEAHRRALQAAAGAPQELAAARADLRLARALRDHLEPDDAERLAPALHEADAVLSALEPQCARRPVATIEGIARVRDRLDLAVGDARSAQQRLRSARAALPSTLAAARSAIARAETAVARAGVGAEARVRLAAAVDDLAAARQASGPVAALDDARRAMRHAEDAKALADYDLVRG